MASKFIQKIKKISKKPWFKKSFGNLFKLGLIIFQCLLLYFIVFRIVPIPITPLMLIRDYPIQKDWIPISKMSKSVPLAVLTSEDPKFFNHYGFDFESIRKVLESNKKGKKIRGASTVSQQTAKNMFLWPKRSWIRKGLEVPLTIMMETMWNKKRIMEVYLNIIEMGEGIYGIEAASQAYYKKSASQLNNREAAGIVVCFPNPIRWNPKKPSTYIKAKQSRITRWMTGYDPFPENWPYHKK